MASAKSMKVKITQKGLYGSDNKPLEVGSVVNVQGDKLPAHMVNKVQVQDGGDTDEMAPAGDGGDGASTANLTDEQRAEAAKNAAAKDKK